jgi:hypothetical protein
MTTVTIFAEAEQALPEDFDAIGFNARRGDENLVGGAIGYPSHWADFTVSTPSNPVIRISQGRYFVDAIVYDLQEPADINLQVHLPLTGDNRYVAIIARGVSETVSAERTIETDADTEELVAQQIAKSDIRTVDFVVQQGLPSPTPLKPQIAANDACVCFVLLSPTGIVAIESSEAHRVKTLYEVEGRVVVLEGQMRAIFARTTTIETDLANLANQIKTIPRPEIVRQLQRDTAATRRLINLPDEARGYFYDPGLFLTEWDTAHADWLARVHEGIRLSFANERDEQLSIVNEDAQDIRLYGDLLMPAWTEQLRVEVDGTGSFRNISQQVHTITNAVRREVSMSSVSYGPTINICENTAEYASVGDTSVGATFAVAGETFVNLGYTTQDQFAAGAAWNSDPASAGHKNYAVAEVSYSSWTQVYWDYITETFSVNGSVYGQTFLNSQPMIATSFDLRFTRIGTDGAVHLMLTEVSVTGTPLLDKVIARSTVQHADLAVGWVKFEFRPSLLESGKRYAFITETTGNHAIATVADNKFAQGSLFYSTDGAWFQGSTDEDFAFRLNAAKFTSTRTVVDFDSLTLENGMTQLRLRYEGWEAAGTSLVWEIKPSGIPEWKRLIPYGEDNPLVGLPASTLLRAVFIGTTDLMPALQLNNRARGITQRHRPDGKAISKVQNFGFSTTEIQIETVVDAFDPARHSLANKVVIGSTVYTPTATTEIEDFTKPSRRTFLSTFTVPATTSCRVRVDYTTDNVVICPFIQNIARYAI